MRDRWAGGLCCAALAWATPAAAGVAETARAGQPAWSSPLVTTTGLLERRVRFDLARRRQGDGADAWVVDGGRGLDLILGPATELQIAAAPYVLGNGAVGFADWPALRLKRRLAARPAVRGDYVLSAWVGLQAPTGVRRLTTDAWTVTPTLAFGKGWGDVDLQGTVGCAVPLAHAAALGHPVQTSLALQYHMRQRLWPALRQRLWPEIEATWTAWPDGRRGGLNQVFLTTGLVLGRLPLADGLGLTLGAGWQTAVAPARQQAWLLTTRLNF